MYGINQRVKVKQASLCLVGKKLGILPLYYRTFTRKDLYILQLQLRYLTINI